MTGTPRIGWLDRLIGLGVADHAAMIWAPLFEKYARPEAFSLGYDELDDFLGQILHESAKLTRLEEGLRYRQAARICAVWPKRFPTLADAAPYVDNPVALANKVYGGRLGNLAPDDGWNYRGRGIIQITGKDNYAAVSKVLGIDLVREPELMARPTIALLAAIAWWEGNVPDGVMGDIVKVTKRVNGGTIGLAERIELTDKAKESLA